MHVISPRWRRRVFVLSDPRIILGKFAEILQKRPEYSRIRAPSGRKPPPEGPCRPAEGLPGLFIEAPVEVKGPDFKLRKKQIFGLASTAGNFFRRKDPLGSNF